jgi:hypothetical protein
MTVLILVLTLVLSGDSLHDDKERQSDDDDSVGQHGCRMWDDFLFFGFSFRACLGYCVLVL